jgi:hypothetical protein
MKRVSQVIIIHFWELTRKMICLKPQLKSRDCTQIHMETYVFGYMVILQPTIYQSRRRRILSFSSCRYA